MSIKELIQKLKRGKRTDNIVWRVDPYEGLDFIFSSTE